MSELDDLLSPEISRAAADAARVPSIEFLAIKGTRHRRSRLGSAVIGAAAAVTAITVGVHQLAKPAITAPTSSPAHEQRTAAPVDLADAATVVDGKHSQIESLSIAPGGPQHRLSQWSACLDAGCSIRRYALAVTADGFAHRRMVAVAPTDQGPFTVEPAGPDHFLLSRGSHLVGVVDLAGRLRRSSVGPVPGPAEAGEFVSVARRSHPLAVNATNGKAHPLAVPLHTTYVEVRGDVMWAHQNARHTLRWSSDGGMHWHSVSTGPTGSSTATATPVVSADPGTRGLLVGLPTGPEMDWSTTVEVSGSDVSAVSAPRRPRAGIDPDASGVLPDGQLQVLVRSWSSWAKQGSASPRAGFYVGSDWSHPTLVEQGPPFATLAGSSVPDVLGVTADSGVLTVYAATPSGSGVVSSTDSGATWYPELAR